ncbi:MAG: helix-turn-helix domain-containing protein [Eubacteriales bacterium]|nr:helix-turn-helix domain-containing protein [Eubacteriales bacterium]
MFKDNIIMLRNINGFSQEYVAEQVNVSRQAYGKWEKGETVPDIEKCALLAELYGTTVDTLLHFETKQNGIEIPPAPKGKFIFGTVTVSERGQIVIPKHARETFRFHPGDRLIVLGDEGSGLALMKAEVFESHINEVIQRL